MTALVSVSKRRGDSGGRWRLGLLSWALVLMAVGCKTDSDQAAVQKPQPTAQATGGAAASNKQPSPDATKPATDRENPLDKLPEKEKVDRIVNPTGAEPYDGPTGTVRGTVRRVGDEPLTNQKALEAIKDGCDLAPRMFEKTFREGTDQKLADVFVAVTEYEGYVPRTDPKLVPVRGEGCAWDARTYGLTFGQVLSIQAVDRRPYVPELMGQPMPAQLFALPGSDPVRLPPLKPGRYRLADSLRLYDVADVVVVPYATFDVTGLDGKFEIAGIPAGEVKLSALLPSTGVVTERRVTIKAGETTEIQLEVEFDADKYEAATKD